MQARRSPDNPIIHVGLHPSLTEHGIVNINGPSLVAAPPWVAEPLGRYYLYFAHHGGSFIRLAVADDLAGPWRIHGPGTLRLDQTPFREHIASPDVHLDEASGRLAMVYHGCGIDGRAPGVEQPAAVAFSRDGLRWQHDRVLPVESYLRVFSMAGHRYGIAKGGRVYRADEGGDGWSFEPEAVLLDITGRHWAVRPRPRDAEFDVFYSRFGDAPEHLYHGVVPFDPDPRKWRVVRRRSLLWPEQDWEGVGEPVEVSRVGAANRPMHELRDPAVFEQGGRTWLLYSVAGEQGIALAELFDD